MPIYEYQCGECRRVFSFLVRQVAHHQAPACPQCGGVRMTRVLSRFAAPKGGRKRSVNPPAPTAEHLATMKTCRQAWRT